ncbi:uncharacterized protein LOC107371642 [Tetranychus urticae]|uniref:uncharacterized protein LOC107371642 n=1 Tax=Tetranychus urticae TaxID=32264 RepID=UPI00077BCEED|nr:uncharacterized protein LOC107371642 [Tetranychus urticae]
MFIVKRFHSGFSGWTNFPSIYTVFGQIALIIYFASFFNGVNGQRNVRPNAQPSSSSVSSSSFQQPKCPYTSGDILGVIVTSVIVTIVVIGLTLILFWFLWKKKLVTLPGNNHSIRDVDLNDKTLQVESTKQSNGNLLNDEDKQYKRLIKSLPPLTNVFNHISHQSKGPIKSLDDTFIMTKPEQVRVQMTGHDFTGLGFNIAGNMRDGIFIKDVLTRGPANESGLIKAGDRIMSVTVSFEKMVYEDALTILSYASPYDVTLQIEKTSKTKANTPNLTGNSHVYITRRLANGYGSSDPSHHRILHPVFRSHSVGELTTRLNNGDKPTSLEDKSFGSIKSINSLLRKIKTSLYRSNDSMKPNQSDKGKTSDYCSNNGLHEVSSDYHHSCYSLDASGLMNNQMFTNSSYILPSSTNDINLKSIPGEIAINMNPKASIISQVKHLSSSADQAINHLSTLTVETTKMDKLESEESSPINSGSPSQSASGKKGCAGKRKAPAPPSPSSSTCSIEMKMTEDVTDGALAVKNGRNVQSVSPGGSQVEIHAVIHQENSEDDALYSEKSLSDLSELKSPAIDVSMSLAMESLTSDEPTTEPHPVNIIKEMNGDVRNGRAQSPAGKSKSCSLSDLTLVKNKKPSSTIILERAVSLDLKDQLSPEENMILHQGGVLEDNQGLLRWSGPKPPVGGPDSLSTTYSSGMLGSCSKTIDSTDDSLTITVDETPQDLDAPKPAERISLKKNGLGGSTESKLRASSKFETIGMVINEEDNIVAPPDGFGSDNHNSANQYKMKISSKPSLENVKFKSAPSLEHDTSSDVTEKSHKNETTSEKFNNLNHDNRPFDIKKPSIIEVSTVHSAFERRSPSPDRLDSTLFNVPESIKIPVNNHNGEKSFGSGKKFSNVVLTEEGNLADGEKFVSNSVSVKNLKSSPSNFKYSEPETIEISSNELSQVMMSHEEFLAHKNKLINGRFINLKSHCNLTNKSALNSTSNHIGSKVTSPTIIQVGDSGDNDFESWSYLSDIENNLPSLSNETRYKTTCDMSPLNEESNKLGEKIKEKDVNFNSENF